MATRSSRPDSRAGRRPERRDLRRHAPAARRVSEDHTEMVYGRNAVREALRGRRRVHSLVVANGSEASEGEALEDTLRDWCQEAGGAIPRVERVSAVELGARLQTPDHQGIAARVDPYPYLDVDVMLGEVSLLVAMDGVQDPHNLGAVIRSAEACGAGVVIPRHGAVQVTAAVVKASAGASEHAAVAQVRNLADFLDTAKKNGFWVYGATAEAGEDYAAQDYSYRSCFVMGSEGRGLGRRVMSLCDALVSLPLLGKVESLNVSVSTGVLLYEAVRQRRNGERSEEGQVPGPRGDGR